MQLVVGRYSPDTLNEQNKSLAQRQNGPNLVHILLNAITSGRTEHHYQFIIRDKEESGECVAFYFEVID